MMALADLLVDPQHLHNRQPGRHTQPGAERRPLPLERGEHHQQPPQKKGGKLRARSGRRLGWWWWWSLSSLHQGSRSGVHCSGGTDLPPWSCRGVGDDAPATVHTCAGVDNCTADNLVADVRRPNVVVLSDVVDREVTLPPSAFEGGDLVLRQASGSASCHPPTLYAWMIAHGERPIGEVGVEGAVTDRLHRSWCCMY